LIVPVSASKLWVVGRCPVSASAGGMRGSASVGSSTPYSGSLPLSASLTSVTTPLIAPLVQSTGVASRSAPTGPSAIAAIVTPTTRALTASRSALRR
jgi:hypothetical protein